VQFAVPKPSEYAAAHLLDTADNDAGYPVSQVSQYYANEQAGCSILSGAACPVDEDVFGSRAPYGSVSIGGMMW
jgi:hypothetical protein